MKKLRKILLVDDEDITCFLNKLILESMGVANEVVAISDPELALQFIHKNYHQQSIPEGHGADLIFLDLNMPGLDGFEILQDMEGLDIDRSQILVVILTSSISPSDREKAHKYSDQLCGYLTKPLRKEDVENLLTTI